jgi:hypothetical protein
MISPRQRFRPGRRQHHTFVDETPSGDPGIDVQESKVSPSHVGSALAKRALNPRASRTCASCRQWSCAARAAGAPDVHPVHGSKEQPAIDQAGKNLLDAVAVQAPQPRGLQRCQLQAGTLKELARDKPFPFIVRCAHRAPLLDAPLAGARPAAWRSGERRARRACRAIARCAGGKCRHELLEVSRTALGTLGRAVAGHKRLEPMTALTASELEQWHTGKIQKSVRGDS